MLLVLAAAALLAATEPTSSTSAPAAEVVNKDLATPPALKPGEKKMKVVCRTETATGTRFGKRVCLSLDDFKRRQEESREGFAEMQRNHNVTPTKGN
ncbi:hypothetical protein M9M90_15350 [Phenylobacterium sp. LH3H17]|uniref:hypothetical protein n=1 Tax=Phenylobacterium sp. LH3H17 TaxID=2903901 RepID=UPI0020C9D7D4|nr:hypothetical protein [Phenylobacterium sp. LH3H17]UTP38585.1 hypothetical protein M9M90_15350 [Phenylobacterium sp. LH3H17]